MASSSVSVHSDEPEFRNGRPVRMAGWIFIKTERWSLSKARYVRLDGEVLSIHRLKQQPAEAAFNIVGADITYSHTRGRRSLRIIMARRRLTCYHACEEEMRSWAQSLEFATNHCFDSYYKLGPLIKEGTSSNVYYVSDQRNSNAVFAAKIVSKKSHNGKALDWMQRERHLNTVLNDPTIVQAVDVFSTLEKDYLVFELMRGGTLADMLLERRKLPESYVRTVMHEVFKALIYLHGKNIVHRDIRPDNVFLSASRFPMAICLGDFGHANFSSEKLVDVDVLTTKVGTLPYVSTDILRLTKYGPSVDMWSAGVMMYELLSGELPFTGSTDRELGESIRLGVFTMRSPHWDRVSAESKRLVRQLLQTDPFKRISALGALQHDWFVNQNGSKRATVSTTRNEQRSLSSTECVSSVSAISEASSWQSRTGVSPSIRAISEHGMPCVYNASPARMKNLLRSPKFQRQLSVAFPYRRKLVVVGRVMVFVFRLQSLVAGCSATYHMARFGLNGIDRVNEIIQRNAEAWETQRECRKLAAEAQKVAAEASQVAAAAQTLVKETNERTTRGWQIPEPPTGDGSDISPRR